MLQKQNVEKVIPKTFFKMGKTIMLNNKTRGKNIYIYVYFRKVFGKTLKKEMRKRTTVSETKNR